MAVYDINGNDLSVVTGAKGYLGAMKPNEKYKIDLLTTISNTLGLSSAQGLAVTGDTAVMLFDKGGILLYDLKTGSTIGQYMLACAESTTHANSASFSKTAGTTYPLLYISECYGQHRCFVEDIGTASSTLVQTIVYDNENGDYTGPYDWILDADGKKIMTYGTTDGSKKLIKVFELPPTVYASWMLTENGKIDEWIVEDYVGEYITTYQGNCVNGNILYLPFSNSEKLLAFDKTSHAMVGKIDLSADITGFPEVEDVAVYNGKLLLSTNNRRIYKISFYD